MQNGNGDTSKYSRYDRGSKSFERYSKKSFRKKYEIEVTETLQRIVVVGARSVEEATAQVTEKYREGEIVLDSSDFVDVKIETLHT